MRRAWWIVMAAWLSACGAPATEAAPVAQQRAAEVQPQASCGAPIEGASPLLVPGGLVLLGELHGTREIPAFAADLACLAAARGLAVRLGVEIPITNGDAIARFVNGPEDPASRAALLALPHWARAQQDGRSSEALVALLERARALRAGGADLTVFAFDAPDEGADWNDRDATMARSVLAQASASPHALTLVLTGDLHGWTVPGLPWDETAIPMGVHVLRARPDARSLRARSPGGTAWACAPECGVMSVEGDPSLGTARRVSLGEPDEHGVHGTFTVGPVHAAPPAVGPR